MTSQTTLQLDVNLSATCGKAHVVVTTVNNALYINLTTFEGVVDLLRAVPDTAVLQPLLAGVGWVGLSDTMCHLQLRQTTILSFKLGQAPLNLRDLLSQSIARFRF